MIGTRERLVSQKQSQRWRNALLKCQLPVAKHEKNPLKPPSSGNSWSVTRIKCPLSVFFFLIREVPAENLLLLSTLRIPKQEMGLLYFFRHRPSSLVSKVTIELEL